MYRNLIRLSSFLIPFALLVPATFSADLKFLRCDPNDDIKVNIADVVWIVQELFIPNSPHTNCQASLDCNNSGTLEIIDAVFLVNYLFRSGPDPDAPFPACATVSETLTCASTSCP